MGAETAALNYPITEVDLRVREQETVLVPSAENSRAYRDALGRFATGVTIITTAGPDGPVGMTVNSFSSVSLDPALVLWSLAKSSGRYAPFCNASNYAIHVLQDSQNELALAFARGSDPFAQCQWSLDDRGVPRIEGALARFDCSLSSQHDAGDHVIIVGAVHRAMMADGDPLVFCKGTFGAFRSGG